jgi:hypothetical protein
MIYWFSFAGLCFIIMLHIVQNQNEAKFGLGQTLASKAKEILNDDGLAPKFEDLGNNNLLAKPVHPENIR